MQKAKRENESDINIPSHDDFQKIFDKLLVDIQRIKGANYKRPDGASGTDATFVKESRRLRKFSNNMLNLFCDGKQRKKLSLDELAELYRKCFDYGFIPFFAQNAADDKLDYGKLYYDFLTLSFTPKKVYAILQNETGLDEDYKKFHSKIRPTTKKGLDKEDNSALAIIRCKVFN